MRWSLEYTYKGYLQTLVNTLGHQYVYGGPKKECIDYTQQILTKKAPDIKYLF